MVSYLRLSVTDRCNLRCVYCMPESGIRSLPHREILTFDEIEGILEAVAALTVYDMCKAVDRWMTIREVRLLEKRGGKSGTVRRPGRRL